ncbi:SDR family oxidoreductase [Kibdelosporangium persicum]|uniref:NADP-dependent 3-hydroxy acid dehydrogenase YdfG n=1 Tax=Kibdelosporangium persicum TaxID=2698649 RepID=A0ABX2EY23_9PSEU|nr:SDR family oxidoreductase [Kibdelosporangium persicum]NRN63919.1 NADP-dependent 3-hydroxy acid dehydrogenase YdfG [Kibdelosporangium persicum]
MQTALVTGASGGIGAAIAHVLAPTHEVWLGGRKIPEGLPGRPWPVDLRDLDALAARTAEIPDLDVLVHSAGMVEIAPLSQTSVRTWRETLELNVIAVAELTRVLLPKLRAANGHVILINSGAGLRVNANWGAYAASKYALRAFADALRTEEPDIRVTSVFPGRTATEMQRGVRATEQGDYEPEKYLKPETVAQFVLNAITAPADAHPTEVVIRPRATAG